MIVLDVWQVVLITLLSGYGQYDGLHSLTGFVKPVMMGALVGLVLGDLELGLVVGGMINLMALGVGSFGGSVVPDYMSAAILGTVFAFCSGLGSGFGVSVAVMVAVLFVQFDVLARFVNVWCYRLAYRYYERRNYRMILWCNCFGVVPFMLSRMVPVCVCLVLGPVFVSGVVDFVPDNVITGLGVAGGLMPAVGVAVLLRYMPVFDNVGFLIIGFVLAAYLGFPIFWITVVGCCCAVWVYFDDESGEVLDE